MRMDESVNLEAELMKIKRRGSQIRRKFVLDGSKMELRYEGSRKFFRRKKTRWHISKIQGVVEGEKHYAKRLESLDVKKRCLAVMFHGSKDDLFLLAETEEIKKVWLEGITYMLQQHQYMSQKEKTDIWIKEAFNLADKNKDGVIDFEEIMKLLKKLNADMDKNYVREMFDSVNVRHKAGKAPTLDPDEFVQFYHKLTERQEIRNIFFNYAHEGYMRIEDLKDFFVQDQKVTVSEDKVERCIKEHEPNAELHKDGRLSLIGFGILLAAEEHQIFNPDHRQVYLAANQLLGTSRVEVYVKVLKSGCRCVELDCWDGKDGQPCIYHGHTLTSPISFHDVICAIKHYAFETSPFPVILSIENHCSVKQQAVMAEICRNVLGELLYAPETVPDPLPSPNDLKNKIILKGKRLSSRKSAIVRDELPEMDQETQTDEKEKKVEICPEFSAVIAFKTESFKGVAETISSDGIFVSLNESKVLKMTDEDPKGLEKLSQNMLVRIYPSGSRVSSSNYNPIPAWNSGCQFVALNYQTKDTEPMQLVHGKFMDNGGCGYVLKPKFLKKGKNNDECKTGVLELLYLFEPNIYDSILNSCIEGDSSRHIFGSGKKLKLRIISGYQIPKKDGTKEESIVDPYVKVEIHGFKNDDKDAQTDVIKNNGLNPYWNKEFSFTVSVPDLALVRFAVYNSNRYSDQFIGYYVLPFNSLRQGYRQFPLFSPAGDEIPKTLILTHVEIKDN